MSLMLHALNYILTNSYVVHIKLCDNNTLRQNEFLHLWIRSLYNRAFVVTVYAVHTRQSVGQITLIRPRVSDSDQKTRVADMPTD